MSVSNEYHGHEATVDSDVDSKAAAQQLYGEGSYRRATEASRRGGDEW